MMSWEDAREKLAALQKASRPPEKTTTIQKWLEDWAGVYLALIDNYKNVTGVTKKTITNGEAKQ